MKKIFFSITIVTFIANCLGADKDQAYQDYLKKCTQASSLVAEHLGNIKELANIVREYFCISYEQWQKNNEDLIKFSNRGDLVKVKELLESQEVNINAENKNGSTALMRAVAGGYKPIVELLIQAKADVNVKNRDGSTALLFAVIGGFKEIVELLINSNANVNVPDEMGYTPLIKARDKEIIELLINAGADINFKDEQGNTALDHANTWGYTEIAKLLKKNSA